MPRAVRDKDAEKAASKKHYDSNPEYYRERNRKVKERNQEYIRAAKSKPCHDCGVQYPYYVMQFDHLPEHGKAFNLGTAVLRRGLTQIKAEIAKCDVVCANCHAIRTWERSHEETS